MDCIVTQSQYSPWWYCLYCYLAVLRDSLHICSECVCVANAWAIYFWCEHVFSLVSIIFLVLSNRKCHRCTRNRVKRYNPHWGQIITTKLILLYVMLCRFSAYMCALYRKIVILPRSVPIWQLGFALTRERRWKFEASIAKSLTRRCKVMQ